MTGEHVKSLDFVLKAHRLVLQDLLHHALRPLDHFLSLLQISEVSRDDMQRLLLFRRHGAAGLALFRKPTLLLLLRQELKEAALHIELVRHALVRMSTIKNLHLRVVELRPLHLLQALPRVPDTTGFANAVKAVLTIGVAAIG